MKRNSSSVAEATRLRVLDLELDLLRREASASGEMLNLTPQEFVFWNICAEMRAALSPGP